MESPIFGFSPLFIFSLERASTERAKQAAAAPVAGVPSSLPQLATQAEYVNDVSVRPNPRRSYDFTLSQVPHLEKDFDGALRARLDDIAQVVRRMGDAVITTISISPGCGEAETAVKFYLAGRGVPISAYDVDAGLGPTRQAADDRPCVAGQTGKSDVVIDVQPAAIAQARILA